ncbi:hypothetical protein DID77_03735, partial [Candidatus Marinamargulisbacteria bacterium SCGC AG-439-L15]
MAANEPLLIALSNNVVRQGQTLKIAISSKKAITSSKLVLSKRSFKLFKEKNASSHDPYHDYVSHIGIHRRLPPKQHL